MSSPSLKLLTEALVNQSPVVQAEAARFFGEAGNREAIPALLAYLENSLHYYKAAGFTALARIGDPSVVDSLCRLADDSRVYNDDYWFGWKSVRAAAGHALLSLGDERGVSLLEELADQNNDVFYSWFAPAILRLRDALPGVPAVKSRLTVKALLEVPERSTRLTDPSRLSFVVEALGVLGGDAVVEPLNGFLSHRSRYVRGQAVLSLTEATGARASVSQSIQDLLADESTVFVQAQVARVLGQGETLQRLIAKASDPFDRATVVECLGWQRDPALTSSIQELWHDSDPYVRQTVLEALERTDSQVALNLAAGAILDPAIRVRLQAAKIMMLHQP